MKKAKLMLRKTIAVLLSLTMLLVAGITSMSVTAAEADDLSSVSATFGDFKYWVSPDDGTARILKCTGTDSDVVIPSEVDGYKVTHIAYSAFYMCESIVNVIIPDGIVCIDDSAFYYCQNLKSITIPDSVEVIYKDAFHACYSLENVIIPDSYW